MQILPLLASSSSRTATSGQTSSQQGTSFAALLGKYSAGTTSGSSASVSSASGSTIGNPLDAANAPNAEALRNLKLTKEDIAALRDQLLARGFSASEIADMEASTESDAGMTWGEMMTAVQKKVATTQSKDNREISTSDQAQLLGFFGKLGFTADESQQLVDSLAKGETQSVWNTVNAKVSGLSSDSTVSLSSSEMASLARNLNLTDSAQTRLTALFDQSNASQGLSGEGLQTAMSLVQNELSSQVAKENQSLSEFRQAASTVLRTAWEKSSTKERSDIHEDDVARKAAQVVAMSAESGGRDRDATSVTQPADQPEMDLLADVPETGHSLPARETGSETGAQTQTATAQTQGTSAQTQTTASQAQGTSAQTQITAPQTATAQEVRPHPAIAPANETAASTTRSESPVGIETATDAHDVAQAQEPVVADDKTSRVGLAGSEAQVGTPDKAQTASNFNPAASGGSTDTQGIAQARQSAASTAASGKNPVQAASATSTTATAGTQQVHSTATRQDNETTVANASGTDQTATDALTTSGLVEPVQSSSAQAEKDGAGAGGAGKRQSDAPLHLSDDTEQQPQFSTAQAEAQGSGSELAAKGHATTGTDAIPGAIDATSISLASQHGTKAGNAATPPSTANQNLASSAAQQVENTLLQNMGQGARQVTLTLQPEELGNLSVTLTVKEKEVRAVIKADRPETSALLQDQATTIRKNLEDQGFKVVKFEVQTSVAQDNSNARQGGAEQHEQARQQRESLEQHRASMRFSQGSETMLAEALTTASYFSGTASSGAGSLDLFA